MKNTVLILTNSRDGEHTSSVENKLKQMGIDTFRLNVDKLTLGEVKLRFELNQDNLAFELKNENESVHSSEITSIWYRRPNEFQFPIKDPQQFAFAERELRSVLEGFWMTLSDRFWISDPVALSKARKKILQWKIARGLGLLVPDTLITNEPDRIIDFYNRHEKRIVIKSMEQAFMEYPNTSYNMPTTLFPETALSQLGLAAKLPVLFQACIKKQHELRITVVEEDIFAVKIDSQKFTETSIDWRHPAFINRLHHELVDLPETIKSKCLEMLRALNLRFGAFDFIVTPEGRYVFLEVNPNGQWYWMEHLIKVPISDSLARALARPINHKP